MARAWLPPARAGFEPWTVVRTHPEIPEAIAEQEGPASSRTRAEAPPSAWGRPTRPADAAAGRSSFHAQMRLELDDPSAARDLVSYLNARPDCVAAETGRGVVEVNLLGSQRLPFMRLELDLRLGAWRAANPGVAVVLVGI